MQGYAFYLSEPTDTSEFDALLPFVSIHRQELINRLRYQNDKIRSLVGDALTRLAIIKEIGLQNRDINFHYLKDQKPTLVHNASFHFSVSHSGNWIICCTDSQPIGVDIEKIQRTDLSSLSSRIYNDQEQATALTLAPSRQLAYFYERWTLKESLLKSTGFGLRYPLNQLQIESDDPNHAVLSSHFQNQRYFFVPYTLDKAYQLAICTLKQPFNDVFRIVSLKELHHTLACYSS